MAFKAVSTYAASPPTTLTSAAGQTGPQEVTQNLPSTLYHCTITIPSKCKVTTASSVGEGYRSKSIAKRHAAFELVKALVKAGEIDSEFRPTPANALPKSGDTRDERRAARRILESSRSPFSPDDPAGEVTLSQRWARFKAGMKDQLPPKSRGPNGEVGIAEYPHFTSAAFWETCQPLQRDELYPTLVELRFGPPHEKSNADCRVMCLLTSREIPIFDGQTKTEIDVGMAGVGMDQVRMRAWEEGKLESAMAFTERVLRAQLNKRLRGDLTTVKWAIVPMRKGFAVGDKVRRRSIAWDEVASASGPLWTPFDLGDIDDQIVDAMITGRSEFSSRYYVFRLRRDLTPYSPHPSHPRETFLTAGKFRATSLQNPGQPMLECDQIYPSKSGGFIATPALPHLRSHFIIPEYTKRHSIPASIFRTTSILPVLLPAIHDLLIARELNAKIFASKLDPSLALLALSCPTAHASNPEKTYERLEMLGDTLLKFVVTVDMYLRDGPSDRINQDRHLMVSNRALQARAIVAGVVPYIRSGRVRPAHWVPAGWSNEEEAESGDGESKLVKVSVHSLGDKVSISPGPCLRRALISQTIADVAEALIAASYLSAQAHIDGAISAILSLGIPITKLRRWSDVVAKAPPPRSIVSEEGWMRAFRPAPLVLLGYEFRDSQIGRDVLVRHLILSSNSRLIPVFLDRAYQWIR